MTAIHSICTCLDQLKVSNERKDYRSLAGYISTAFMVTPSTPSCIIFLALKISPCICFTAMSIHPIQDPELALCFIHFVETNTFVQNSLCLRSEAFDNWDCTVHYMNCMFIFRLTIVRNFSRWELYLPQQEDADPILMVIWHT